MVRVQIFIDAGNFYHLVLKKLGRREADFDFEGFAQHLCGSERQLTAQGKRYYVGTVREQADGHETKRAMARQTALFTRLIGTRWQIQTSKLRTRLERVVIDDRVEGFRELLAAGITEVVYRRSREKGIDVKLATDLLVGAVDNQYDHAVVVSSDTDLVPAVQWVRTRYAKQIEYVGFSLPQRGEYEPTKPVRTMMYNADVQRVLVEADLTPFLRS